MRSRFSLILSLCAVPALIAGVLTAAPASVAAGASGTQLIKGTVAQADGDLGPVATNIRVSLHTLNGLKTTRIKTMDISASSSYSFRVRLGARNAPSAVYRLSVSGVVGGERHEWFYRSAGAARYIVESQGIQATSAAEKVVDFTYGSLTGTVTGADNSGGIGGATVRIAAVPINRPTKTIDRRELDNPYCANDFDAVKTRSGGSYSAGFVPSNGKFVVQVAAPASSKAGGGKPYMKLWNDTRGTCIGTIGTNTDRAIGTYDVELKSSNARIAGDIDFKTGKTAGDRFVILRTNDPNRTVVGTDSATSGGAYAFGGLAPGSYKVEYAKRTGCAGWFKSRYANNSNYLEGEDRGNEKWKSFRRLRDLSAGYERIAKSHGATASQNRSPGGGFKGWMYRDHCAENHAERTLAISATSGLRSVNTTLARGATISGRVTRKGGKSNKEMLVTAFRKDNRYVARTAITNGSGGFKITGLASGGWSIMVNADSWRGIGRSFSGPHSKSVTAGKGYSTGRLHANF